MMARLARRRGQGSAQPVAFPRKINAMAIGHVKTGAAVSGPAGSRRRRSHNCGLAGGRRRAGIRSMVRDSRRGEAVLRRVRHSAASVAVKRAASASVCFSPADRTNRAGARQLPRLKLRQFTMMLQPGAPAVFSQLQPGAGPYRPWVRPTAPGRGCHGVGRGRRESAPGA